MSELPRGWSLAPLDVVSNLIRGVTYNKSECTDFLQEGYLPVLRANNIQSGKLQFDDLVFVLSENIKDVQKIKKGDIVIAMSSGSKRLVGKSGIAETNFNGGFGAFCGLLRPSKQINSKYVGLYTLTKEYSDLISSLSKGVNINNLKPVHFSEINIPIAPLNEQIRIANKLDSLLAKVDTAQTRLEKIPVLLKRFRQSVLAAATSGELTREWRVDNDLDDWGIKKLSDIVIKIEAGKNISCDERPPEAEECGIIKISAVTWGTYDELESKTLSDRSLFQENRRVMIGDFLISRANTLELLGMSVIVHSTSKNLMLSDKVLRLVMHDSEKMWLNFFLRSPKGRVAIESKATGNQQSMRNIGQKALLEIQIPYPSFEEKTEIVRRVESLFALADTVEKQYLAAKQRLDRLSQSLLAKAFRGELVPQDPNDEPAAELLKRIQAERQAQPVAKQKRSKPA